MPRPSSLCTSQRAPETAKSPLPSSPSTSPSSPSSPLSFPSSPSSTSPRRMGTGYHEDKDGGHAGNNRVSRAAGDGVSSTSSSLGPSSLSLPQSTSLGQSQRLTLPPLPYGGVQRQDVGMEIYDPFQPTEGDGIPGTAEDEEGDKYDPFEPTGSPGSEKEEEEEEEREMDGEQEEEGSVRSDLKDVNEVDLNAAAEAQGLPPDSTETLEPTLASEDASAVLDDMRRLKERTRERRKSSREQRVEDSENSEIEEGEIVGAGESIREREMEIRREVLLPSPGSPSFLQGGGLKPERILRVLDGEDFVSVRAEGEWDREPVPPIAMGDLRRKLTNRRKQRFRSCPSSASISPPPVPTALPLPSPSPPASPPQSVQKSMSRKSSKSSKERDRRKRKGQDKDKRKKRKDVKADLSRGSGESKDRNQDRRSRRDDKERDKERRRSSRSHSRTRRSARQSTPDPVPHSHNASRHAHGHRSCSRERDRERARDKDREKDRERDRYRDRRRDDRDRERDRDSRRRDERKRERDEVSRRSSSRERGHAKRIRESSERRERDKERGRERERDRRRDGRPVVPPSIQDLNGSDLFAIKRTITVTPAPTGMVSSPPSHARDHTRSPTQGSDKSRKRKRKRRRRSDDEDRPEEERRSRSRPSSPTPLRYHGYESDRLSDHPEPDLLSLDGEALDSDYPSLEDSPLLPPPPEPLLPSPKPNTSPPKSSRHHQKKKSRSGSKKLGQSESSTSSSSHRPKQSKPSPLSASSGNPASLPPPASSSSVKRARKTGKDKLGKKDASRSGKSKKPGGRKAKLQSKVSVLVREGVSSTTGNSGKLGLDLLGPSGPTGPSVVGGSIAVVFRRDNESRSPFLKPCSEPLSLPGRAKDMNKSGKPRNLLASLSSTNPQGLKSKKVKPSSTTSTSSSASSPTSSSVTKRRRRPGKKPREKGMTVDGPDGKGSNSSTLGSGWTGASADIQPLGGVGPKPSSPPSTLPGPTPSSSSSSSSSTSSTSVLPPSSSPPHTPPLSLPPSRDTRESSPDSQTVDSSCKTPEPSFLLEECPAQSQSTMLAVSKSPPSPPPLRGDGMQCASKPLPPDDLKMSPPCPTSSALGTVSLSHSIPAPVAEPSSSSSASVSSSSVSKPPPPPPPPSAVPPLPWSLQAGVDCTAGGVLALTALLFKMEEANLASRAKAQEFIQATSQILSQANQNQSQAHSSSSSSQVPPPPPPPPSHAPPSGPTPAQFILHGSLPLVGCNKTQPSHVHPGLSLGGGCAQTPPPLLSTGPSGGTSETGWDSESKDPDKYLKKLHTQERAVEEVKLAIKPYYQRKDINKDEYKDILRKAVHKICHSRTGEINPVKVSNLVKLYVQRYKYFRKHGRKMDEEDKEERESASLHSST